MGRCVPQHLAGRYYCVCRQGGGDVRAAVDAVDYYGALDATSVVCGKCLADVASALKLLLVGLVRVAQLLNFDMYATTLKDKPVGLILHRLNLVGTQAARNLHVRGSGPCRERP